MNRDKYSEGIDKNKFKREDKKVGQKILPYCIYTARLVNEPLCCRCSVKFFVLLDLHLRFQTHYQTDTHY